MRPVSWLSGFLAALALIVSLGSAAPSTACTVKSGSTGFTAKTRTVRSFPTDPAGKEMRSPSPLSTTPPDCGETSAVDS